MAIFKASNIVNIHASPISVAVTDQLVHLFLTAIFTHESSPSLIKTAPTLPMSVDLVFLCAHCFSHPLHDKTLNSDFRLHESDEFIGTGLDFVKLKH